MLYNLCIVGVYALRTPYAYVLIENRRDRELHNTQYLMGEKSSSFTFECSCVCTERTTYYCALQRNAAFAAKHEIYCNVCVCVYKCVL